jgi:hypothetical protein
MAPESVWSKNISYTRILLFPFFLSRKNNYFYGLSKYFDSIKSCFKIRIGHFPTAGSQLIVMAIIQEGGQEGTGSTN